MVKQVRGERIIQGCQFSPRLNVRIHLCVFPCVTVGGDSDISSDAVDLLLASCYYQRCSWTQDGAFIRLFR